MSQPTNERRRAIRWCAGCGRRTAELVYTETGRDLCTSCFSQASELMRMRSAGNRAGDLHPDRPGIDISTLATGAGKPGDAGFELDPDAGARADSASLPPHQPMASAERSAIDPQDSRPDKPSGPPPEAQGDRIGRLWIIPFAISLVVGTAATASASGPYSALIWTLLALDGVAGLAVLLRSERNRRTSQASLGELSSRLDRLNGLAPIAVLEIETTGRIAGAYGALTLLGWTEPELIGRYLSELTADDHDTQRSLAAAMTGEPAAADSEWLQSDGRSRLLRLDVQRGDRPDVLIGTLTDRSEIILAEAAVRRAHERINAVIHAASGGLALVERSGEVVVINNAARDLLLTRAGDGPRLGGPFSRFEKISGMVANQLWGAAQPSRAREQFPAPDGAFREIEVTVSGYAINQTTEGALVELHDVTNYVETADEMRRISQLDPLTGLANRSRIEARVTEEIEIAGPADKRVAVVMVDLDRFKIVNDTLGHAAGDQVIRATADRLLATLSANYSVARYGGDEFMVVSPAIDNVEAAITAVQAISKAMTEPFSINGQTVHVTASVGVALYPDDGLDPDTLLRMADAAMYSAKELGGDGYQFVVPTIDHSAQRSLTLESSLRKALENGEFVVYFQPIVRTVSERPAAVEALLRWEHPVRGLLPPLSFVSLLEESGLIAGIGEWVLKTACAAARSWLDADIEPVRVAVNVSPHQLRKADFTQTVRGILEETGLDPQWLELEITESAALRSAEGAVQSLLELRELGVSIVIDDFGTGHSSLTRLKELPVNGLKIDQSFVRTVATDRDARAIVNGVIALAHALDLTVVAEGVETRAQRDALRTLGCDELQGFLFGRPLPEAAMRSALMRDRVAA